MKVSIAVLSCFVVPFSAASSMAGLASPTAENKAVLFKPLKISFRALEDDAYFAEAVQDSFIDALKTVGIVSITNVPGLKAMKESALSWDLHHCAKESEAAKAHQFPDGTVRHTLATHTLPGGYQHKFDHKSDSSSCKTFSAASDTFRTAVDGVTDAFAARLSSILKIQDKDTPLLSTEAHYPFATLADVVKNGEHLEHFHSYQHVVSQGKHQDTIDLHTDQGLFLVFTPGRMVNRKDDGALTTGFFIELQDGSLAMVDFDNEDDLVILLGDGVNQYVNPRLGNGETLRAAPHALALPEHSDDEARVWYGRMVLPPATAIHPEHGRTFEDLRKTLVEASITSSSHDANKKEEELSIGCSSSMVARQLESESCQGDTLMCWHRCMNITEAGVSEDICAERSLSVMCINPRGQLWDNTHGDFFPGCASNETELATPYPALPNAPRDDSECTDAAFAEFVKSTTTGYENSFDLGKGGVFMWTASPTNGHVEGRLAYNGLFGWLAFGFANVGGAKNGMHGANILMAIPGGNYSAVTGFDLSINASVQEYEISENAQQSSFRFWDTSSDGLVATTRHAGVVSSIEETDCFTSFSFLTEDINGVSFNITGVDELIWAANANDTFAGYHPSRGRFSIDWRTSEAKLYVAPDATTSAPATTTGSASSATKSVVSSLGAVLVMISVVAEMTFAW